VTDYLTLNKVTRNVATTIVLGFVFFLFLPDFLFCYLDFFVPGFFFGTCIVLPYSQVGLPVVSGYSKSNKKTNDPWCSGGGVVWSGVVVVFLPII
jgi:hypothetical protein